MIVIEFAKPTDEKALFALFKRWDDMAKFDYGTFASSFARVLADPKNRILVAHDGDAIAGYAQCFPIEELGFAPALEIAQFLVAPESRSRGIGAALLGRVEDAAREAGIARIKLSSQTFRERAHVFYERHGFKKFKDSKFYEKTL